MHFIFVELSLLCSVRPQNAERPVLARNNYGNSTHNIMVEQQRGPLKTTLTQKVFDNHWLACSQREPWLSFGISFYDCTAHQTRSPSCSGPQNKRFLVRL